MDRDCKNCIHNIGGDGCKKWDCEMETLAENDKNPKKLDQCLIDELGIKMVHKGTGIVGFEFVEKEE